MSRLMGGKTSPRHNSSEEKKLYKTKYKNLLD